MTPVCEGAGSHLSLVITVLWPSALATLSNKFGQNSCILVVSQPLETLHRSAFSNLAIMGIWSCDTPLWWRIKFTPFALYLINWMYESSQFSYKVMLCLVKNQAII